MAATATSVQPLAATVPDRHVPRLSIRLTLVALVAACLVPPFAALAALVYVDFRTQEAAMLHEAVARARTMMLLVDGDLEGVESALEVLATADAFGPQDLARFQQRLVQVQKSQIARSFVVYDREGRQRVNTLVPFGGALPQTGLPSQLDPVFTASRTALSGVFRSTIDGTPVVAMAVPVMKGSDVPFAVVASIAPEQILASTREAMPDGWIAAVLDTEGNIIARSTEAARYVGQPASPSLLDAIAGKAEGTSETTTYDGRHMMTAFSRSPKSRWVVAVGAPKTMLEASLDRSIAALAAGTLIALALVVWFAVRVSRAVTQAVGGMVEPALALGAGRAVELTPTPFRETDAVGRALRQASRMLAAAQYHAYHDPLTNLRNRTLFDEMATRQIAQAYRDGAQFAILAIDLDGFKAVNDVHGHAAGDTVLKTVADRITGLVRGSDVVSRRGGDEFSVMLVDVDGVRTRQIAEKLLAALSQPYPDVRPVVSASIGVARYPHDATTLHELLERADEALYAAKHAGKRRVAGDL